MDNGDEAGTRDGMATVGTESAPRTVGILVFDEVEVLDFCGPFEVFASAALPPSAEGGEERRLYDVLVLAERPGIVRCRGGLLVQPHHTLADHPPLDLVVVPGGFGTRRERGNPVVLRWIERQHAGGVLTTSVCTGAFLLAATGLLNGRAATTHWASIDGLRRAHPAVAVRADERIVDQGQVVTSAGVSAGIDMALHVVRRQHGEAVARATARDMEYDWAR
ncbi:MAG: Intracellular protease [uncultured Thermomicrobiales bacterium]|uniref:Intracellular protease n=1 Tax=uncultured Thermomicrobiales bacterium TaxID=1645740 RepID=A0A6J4VK18_9BACT|nr:MAG: Intracellular protease [uncultured Thermomicrobiales bacterium]